MKVCTFVLFFILGIQVHAQYWGGMSPSALFNSIQYRPTPYNMMSPYTSPFYWRPPQWNNYSVWPQTRAPRTRQSCTSPLCGSRSLDSEYERFKRRVERWREDRDVEDKISYSRFYTTAMDHVDSDNDLEEAMEDDGDLEVVYIGGVDRPKAAVTVPAPAPIVATITPPGAGATAPAPAEKEIKPNPVGKTEAGICVECEKAAAPKRLSVTQQTEDLLSVITNSDKRNAAYGMEKLMSAVYQTCVGFEGPIVDPDLVGPMIDKNRDTDASYFNLATKHNPYLENYRHPPATEDQCYDVRALKSGSKTLKTTVGFNYLKKYNFDRAKNIIYHTRGPDKNILKSAARFYDSERATLGTSCSEALSAGMYAAGLKFVKNRGGAKGVPPFGSPLNTDQMSAVLNLSEKDRCLDFVDYSKDSDSPIKRGDIMVAPKRGRSKDDYHHALVVESIGATQLANGVTVADPYGVLKQKADGVIKNADDCDKVDAKLFNFTIIHNSSAAGRIGFSHLNIKDWIYDNYQDTTDVRAFLIKEAAKFCRSTYTGNAGFSSQPSVDRGREMFVARPRTSDPDCVTTPMELEGEDCIKGCRGY